MMYRMNNEGSIMMYRMNKADAAFAARAAEGARASWLAAKAFSGGPSGHSVIRIQETK